MTLGSAVLVAAIRHATIALKIAPVMMGSAYKNKAVQLLLDGVAAYLPNPMDIVNKGVDLDQNEAEVTFTSDPALPLVMLAFKLEDGKYG